MIGRDTDISLRASGHPEFDAWRWTDFWVPRESVIEFKRGVYKAALNELADILFQGDIRARPKSYALGKHGQAPVPSGAENA